MGQQMQHIINQEDCIVISKQHPLEVVWPNGHVGKEGRNSGSEVTSLVPLGV